MITVVFAMSGSVRRNSRALKQIQILSDCGYKVVVADIKAAEPFSDPKIANTEWHHLDVQGSGPKFFREVHQTFYRFTNSQKADVYHASDLYVLAALRKVADQQSAKLVYDSRELYPYVASTKGKPWASLFWSLFESKNIKSADLVFTVSQSIADTLKNLYPMKNPIVLWNIPSSSQNLVPKSSIREDLNLADETPLVLHQGQMKKARGCAILIDAMKDLDRGIHCVFLGGGPFRSELVSKVKQEGLSDRVHFLDPVPSDQLINYVKKANLGVSLLEDTCLNHRFALPNKLFEYLRAGLPVLVSDLPEMANIVRQFDVGEVTDLSSPSSLAASIDEMLGDQDALKRRSKNTPNVFEKMNWDIAADRFRSAYEGLLSDKLL